jgi:hypothetical protein
LGVWGFFATLGDAKEKHDDKNVTPGKVSHTPPVPMACNLRFFPSSFLRIAKIFKKTGLP